MTNGDLVLQTKLHIPPRRPNVIARPHLVDKLNAAGQQPLTLISAPAGFGKTTLLCEWIHQQEKRVAWLSLDKEDNDLSRLLAHLAAAISWLELRLTKPPAGLGQTPEKALPSLINQIASTPEPFILVLDDYHWIKASPVHQALAFLLEHQPAQMHLVIASRVDPPLSISRLRGQGAVTELRLGDLRFDRQETAAFLKQTAQLELPNKLITALTSRTEGWIAGLQMAAVSLQGKPAQAVAGFVQAFTGSNRYVMDYLVEEVLGQQPDSIQHFLLRTSILDRLTSALCDALWTPGSRPPTAEPDAQSALDIRDGQSMLEHLERSNLFLVPLDEERLWYRYHHLFASLLRKRLQQTSPDLAPTLHRQASTWFEQAGMMGLAIDHALAAADFPRAGDLLEHHAETALMRGEFATFVRWVEALPSELRTLSPEIILYYQAARLLLGHPLADIESKLVELETTHGALAGKIIAVRALMTLYQGKIPQAIALSQQAQPMLAEGDLFLQHLVAWNLALSPLEQDDYTATIQALTNVAEMGRESGHIIVAVGAICAIARLNASRGQLQAAAERYQQALVLATEKDSGRRLPIAGRAMVGLGDLWREWNDLEKARQYLEEGIELARPLGDLELIEGHLALALVSLGQGASEQGHAEISQANQLLAEFNVTELDSQNVAACQARLSLREGNLEAVGRWAEQHRLSSQTALAELAQSDQEGALLRLRQKRRWSEYMMLARYLIRIDQPAEALRFLEPLQQMEERLEFHGRLIGVLTLKALALHSLGQAEAAAANLQRALSLAHPEGYVRIFVDEGNALIPLLQMLAQQGVMAEYALSLLAAMRGDEPGQQSIPQQPHIPAMLDALSQREMEVLQLLDTDLSVPEIADTLFVAASTIRSHIKQIYSKLGVHRRREAVHKAEGLGLLRQ